MVDLTPPLEVGVAEEEPGLEELGAGAEAGLDAAVDVGEAREGVGELVERPVERGEVGLVEDERVAVEGDRGGACGGSRRWSRRASSPATAPGWTARSWDSGSP